MSIKFKGEGYFLENYLGIRRKIKDGRKDMKMKEAMQKMKYLIDRSQRKEGKREKSTVSTKMYKEVPQYLIKYMRFHMERVH